MPVTLIGLDADDTLWHNETFFRLTPDASTRCWPISLTCGAGERACEAVERRNLCLYGYGAKGFTLSMLETALEVSAAGAPRRLTGDLAAAAR
jgi:putative hydrolase of the HAD superfamily